MFSAPSVISACAGRNALKRAESEVIQGFCRRWNPSRTLGSRRGAINSGECAAWPQGFASRGKFCFRREISIILPTFPATLGLEVNMEVEAQLVNQRGCTLNLKTAKVLGLIVFQPDAIARRCPLFAQSGHCF
jgi:hypothetical protein